MKKLTNTKEAAKVIGNLGNLAPIPEEEVLVQRGYRLIGKSDFLGVPVMYHYVKDIDVSDASSFLGERVVDRALSYLSILQPSPSREGYKSFGSFRATLFLPMNNGDDSTSYTRYSHSYSYSFVSLAGSERLPFWFLVEVSGGMSGPYPEGVPESFNFGSRILVPSQHSPSSLSRRELSRRVKEISAMLFSLLSSLKDVPGFLMSSEVYLVSGSPIPEKDQEGGEESGKVRSPSYLYIGTVGDLLSGFLGDHEGKGDLEEEEEEEEDEEEEEEEDYWEDEEEEEDEEEDYWEEEDEEEDYWEEEDEEDEEEDYWEEEDEEEEEEE